MATATTPPQNGDQNGNQNSELRPRTWTVIERGAYRFPPGLSLNLPFYIIRRFFNPSNPILLFQHLAATYGRIAYYKLGWQHIVFINEPEFIRDILINHPQEMIKERTPRRLRRRHRRARCPPPRQLAPRQDHRHRRRDDGPRPRSRRAHPLQHRRDQRRARDQSRGQRHHGPLQLPHRSPRGGGLPVRPAPRAHPLPPRPRPPRCRRPPHDRKPSQPRPVRRYLGPRRPALHADGLAR